MPEPLTCLFSFGLACAPAPAVKEAPPPTPLEPAEPSSEDEADLGPATQLLVKVQGYYDKTSDLEAKFRQTYTHAVYKKKNVSSGTLKIKKPGKMIWDYDDESNPDIWVDENELWAVERAQRQVVRRDLAGSDIAGAEKFLFGGRQLTEDFLVKLAGDKLEKQYGQPGHTAIRLRPKRKNANYRELLLVVDDATGRVDSFVVLNTDNSTNRFELSALKRNQGLPAAQFEFSKPKGYVEIEG